MLFLEDQDVVSSSGLIVLVVIVYRVVINVLILFPNSYLLPNYLMITYKFYLTDGYAMTLPILQINTSGPSRMCSLLCKTPQLNWDWTRPATFIPSQGSRGMALSCVSDTIKMQHSLDWYIKVNFLGPLW